MNRNEIDPKLRKELEQLRDVPERGLQASHTGRERYLAQVRSLKPGPAHARKSTRKFKQPTWARRFAVIAAVLVLALSSLGGTVYAAQASGPDDLLYGVKIFSEEVKIKLESDPEDRLDLLTSFANRRLGEIQAQIDAGEDVSQQALVLLDKHTQNMLNEAAQMGEEGLNNALRQIEQNLQKQNQMMAEMGKQHPQGGPPGLLRAQEKIRERLELIENGIKEPAGFKEEIRKENQNSADPGQGNKNGEDNSNKPEVPPGQENKDHPGNGQGNGKGKGQGAGAEDQQSTATSTP